MSQQNKQVIIWLKPPCKFKNCQLLLHPLWNSLHLLFCGLKFYTLGPRVRSDVVEEGERWREGQESVCDAHVCDLTTMGVKQH